MRPSRRALLAGAGVGALGVAAAGAFAPAVQARMARGGRETGERAIEIRAAPLPGFSTQDRELRRFGALHFLSGLVLTSSDRGFGGLSGLHLSADGRELLAVTDVGEWLAARLDRDAAGAMTGLSQARMAPLLGADGRPMRMTGRWDAEALALGPDGRFCVGFERVGEIWRFDVAGEGLAARARAVAIPPSLRRLTHNKGIEAMSYAPPASPMAGALLAIAERSHGQGPTTIAALVGGPSPGDLAFARRDEFDVSDCAFLPDGDLIVLERRFRWRDGVAVRLRRVPARDIRPGAILQGASIFEATMAQEIDNLEGLALTRDAAGRVVLTLVSDDNFSWLQRTVLLQFRLDG